MKAFATPARRWPAADLAVPLAVAAAIVLGIVSAAVLRIGLSAEQFRGEIAQSGARHVLAVKADEAYRDALMNEKDAMVMVAGNGFNDYAAGWMTSMDHLKAAIASLQLLPGAPAGAASFDDMWGAIEAYSALGEQMYQLKLDQRSGGAIAISTGAAQAARDRLDHLIRIEVDGSASDMAASTARFEREIALIAAFSLIALTVPIAAAATLIARRIGAESSAAD